MKKRIIALLLSFSVLCCTLSFCKRASAAPAAIGVIDAIGVLAFELIGVMNGSYDTQADAIGSILTDVYEGGKIVFYGDDITFNGEVLYHEPGLFQTGVSQIASTLQIWFDNGDFEIVNGETKLTYEQFKELYGQLLSVTAKPNVDFDCGFNTFFLSPFMSELSPVSVPQIPSYVNDKNGQGLIPVFYSDTEIYFSPFYFYMDSYSNKWYFQVKYLNSNLNSTSNVCGLTASNLSFNEVMELYRVKFSLFPDTAYFNYTLSGGDYSAEKSLDYLFKLDGGFIKQIPSSDFSLDGLTAGYVNTTGDMVSFLKSIKGYFSELTVNDTLDDLSGTIPTEYDPSLSFPTDPKLSRPILDQITVGDVPGSPDLSLSDYQADVDVDIDIPSIIVSKFPFCIPFDFVRFLGVLLADPVAPVFRIPISTSPENLEQWEGNQTLDEYLNPDNPLFEIDEEIVIDLSVIPLVKPIFYTCFIVLLLHITSKMIQH